MQQCIGSENIPFRVQGDLSRVGCAQVEGMKDICVFEVNERPSGGGEQAFRLPLKEAPRAEVFAIA
jgi:hypothetical protein